MVKIGDTAPAFTLKTTDKSDVSLSDYYGKNVIWHSIQGHLQVFATKKCALFRTTSANLVSQAL